MFSGLRGDGGWNWNFGFGLGGSRNWNFYSGFRFLVLLFPFLIDFLLYLSENLWKYLLGCNPFR